MCSVRFVKWIHHFPRVLQSQFLSSVNYHFTKGWKPKIHSYTHSCILTFVAFSAFVRLPKNMNEAEIHVTSHTYYLHKVSLTPCYHLLINTWTIFNISYIRETSCTLKLSGISEGFLHGVFKCWDPQRYEQDMWVFLYLLHSQGLCPSTGSRGHLVLNTK